MGKGEGPVKTGLTKGGTPEGKLRLAAVGMEAEFELWIDDERVRPEDVFGDPRAFLAGPLVHRQGTSYQLPTGGTVYFDTGVIEVATPVIELEAGAAARAGRSLWETLHVVRGGLDGWERRTGKRARLVGFSAHYNTSFEAPERTGGAGARAERTVEKLAWMLSWILPLPVMLVATNRRSSGVGVRPRGDRIEVTVDFTPSAALTIATGTLVAGIVREAMRWPRFDVDELERRGIPVISGFAPMAHTSRKGWLARSDCFPADPFGGGVDDDRWRTTAGEHLTLREIAGRITAAFDGSIRRVSDPFTFRLLRSIVAGRAPSLLDLPDRPPEYEDVGRLCTWGDLFPARQLRRSRYERVIIHAVAGRRLRLDGRWYRPVGMRGWSAVRLRSEEGDAEGAAERVVPIDDLLDHLDAWDEPERVRSGHARRRRRHVEWKPTS